MNKEKNKENSFENMINDFEKKDIGDFLERYKHIPIPHAPPNKYGAALFVKGIYDSNGIYYSFDSNQNKIVYKTMREAVLKKNMNAIKEAEEEYQKFKKRFD